MITAIAKEAMDKSGLKPSDIDWIIGAAVSLRKELGFKLDTPYAEYCRLLCELIVIR